MKNKPPFRAKFPSRNTWALLVVAVLWFSGESHLFAQTAEELGITTRSSFQGSEERDPFWPIGWSKPSAIVMPGESSPVELVPQPDHFAVTSISLDRIPLAIINGKPYGEGDSLIWLNGATKKSFKLQIISIRDGAVTLRYDNVKVVCPLRIWQKPAAVSSPTPTPAR